ncbi:hypothetical protein BU15DRAFT_50525, partial [Melanogaster broomeanus]
TQTSPAPDTLLRRPSFSRGSVMSAPVGTISAARSHTRNASTDLSGSGSRTTVSNASSLDTPRRANSLTYGSSSPVQTHPVTADALATSSATKPKGKRNSRQGMLHKPHGGNGRERQSLMSIVEDVARQNRQGWGAGATSVPPLPNGVGITASKSQHVNQLTDVREKQTRSLDLPRTPGSAVPVSAFQPHSPPSTHVSSPSTVTATPTLKAGNTDGHLSSSSRPAKSPLRSALRNSSRTPSPSPARLAEPSKQAQEVEEPYGMTSERDLRPHSPSSPRDSASISSYETGRESFGEVESSTPTTHSYFPPLPAPPSHADHVPEPPSSTASTETPPVRRKSVRVSLHPTFSPTPPALYDHDEGAYAPWNKSSLSGGGDGWKARNGLIHDVDLWQDSSEEDEEYSRARKLLSRVGKKEKGNGKA